MYMKLTEMYMKLTEMYMKLTEIPTTVPSDILCIGQGVNQLVEERGLCSYLGISQSTPIGRQIILDPKQ